MPAPRMLFPPWMLAAGLLLGEPPGVVAQDRPTPLPGTRPLEATGDIASEMVAGVDRFLLKRLDEARQRREEQWSTQMTPGEDAGAILEAKRRRLSKMIGLVDEQASVTDLGLVATTEQPALVARGDGYEAHAVRWAAFGDVHGEGLLLTPTDARKIVAQVVAIPDAGQTPEQLVGLSAGVAPASQYARRLAENGCRVLVPVIINRDIEPRNGRARLTSREFLYRSAFVLGRHLIGYEVHKVLAAVDWFARQPGAEPARIGVIGWGEGALLALHAGALDERIDAVCLSGYFGRREDVWREPIDRNVFGLLNEFGDAELATMIAPRAVIVEAARGPELVIPAGLGGAPARLETPKLRDVRSEVARARRLAGADMASDIMLVESGDDGQGPFASDEALAAFLAALAPRAELAAAGASAKNLCEGFDPAQRHARQMYEIDRHNQQVLSESAKTRDEFFSKLDASTPEAYEKSITWYRDYFAREVIGGFDLPPSASNPRTRKIYDAPAYTGYEVMLDVFPDVIAHGILLVPKDVQPDERRPVVVCQHGLEGRARDVVTGDHPAYHDFAARLAERGFVTFAPQNLYIFEDRFRTLQRKANPLGKTLFSIITPQHRRLTDWLAGLDFVDPQRIAFYGLSYGGKTAMRVPALVERYCLSICSADFNDWVWKNASTSSPHSYVWTGEYEIFEFNLGGTFNYAEMAALIAPRPFMVERGHFDGVAPDEAVAHEFAKVRRLYAARLGLADRARIEWFAGPHTIHGVGTFAFLHEHLDWPANPPP